MTDPLPTDPPQTDPQQTDPQRPSHDVGNQPPPFEHSAPGTDPWSSDAALRDAMARYQATWAHDEIHRFARQVGSAEVVELGHQANRNPPELRTHDRFGRRIDTVRFHPAWDRLMALGKEAEVHCLPWHRPGLGAHVARAAKHYLLAQAEAGVLCPLTMTFAAVPALRADPDVAATWIPRLVAPHHDGRFVAADQKQGCLMGMAMTEKQGGSDVRANTTRAEADAAGDGHFRLTGHKWFCSAPTSDAFLTLAHTDGGLTCFLVPRFTPDGEANPFYLQRLKDKLGNRSNASSEVEFRHTWGRRLGDDGRGIATILEMVTHTRLDCALGSAGMMRQALAQAIHHASHRAAFGRLLRHQPLMKNVLADLALEVEAATALGFRLAHAYDASAEGEGDPERPFRRVATAIAKYWVCKRGPVMVAEAMECLGGGGYVEESILPRLYREMPLNSIWEGSGNVMCLDVLRALGREPDTAPALVAELDLARGGDRRLDAFLDRTVDSLRADGVGAGPRDARRLVEHLALALQASLLVRHAPAPVADAFVTARLADGGLQFGTLPSTCDLDAIIDRAWPAT